MTEHEKKSTNHKLPLPEFIRRHSPLKDGLVVKDEEKPLSKYDKVMNRIYLGNYQAAKDREFFEKENIKAVLNCTKDIPNHFAHRKDIEYMRIPVDDSLKERDFDLMYKFFPSIVEFIHKHANLQKQNIFINCYAGRQRSAIAVAAYLVAKHRMTPHEACKYILSKGKEAFHYGLRVDFADTLNKFHKDLQK